MIIKNGKNGNEQVEITEKDLKKLLVEKGHLEDEKKEIKYPLIFMLQDKAPYIWWDSVNKKRRSPRAVGVPCEVKVNEKGAIITYRYADT